MRPGVAHLSIGGLDLLRDLYADDGALPMLYVQTHLVVVSRAAGLPPPVDSVYPLIDDDAGLRAEAEFVRSLGFGAKSATTRGRSRSCTRRSRRRRANWSGRGRCSRRSRTGAAGARLPDGEFVDLPVAQRAQRLLEIAGHQWRQDPLGT